MPAIDVKPEPITTFVLDEKSRYDVEHVHLKDHPSLQVGAVFNPPAEDIAWLEHSEALEADRIAFRQKEGTQINSKVVDQSRPKKSVLTDEKHLIDIQ